MITIYDRTLIHSTITESPVWANADNFTALIHHDREEKKNFFSMLAAKLQLTRSSKQN